MAKENLFDKVKKAIKGDPDHDSDQDQPKDESDQIEVRIDGERVIVPTYIAINLKNNKQ